MPLLVGMTEVSAQTTIPPTSDTVQPVEGAPLTALVSPASDNTTLNPNQSAAKMETQAGAGGGVDLEKMDTNAYERLMESLPEEVEEVAPQGGAAPVPSTSLASPSAATLAEVQPGTVEHEEGILAPGNLPSRLKVPTDDPLSFHTARLFKEARLDNRPMTFGEAERLAMGILGMDAAPSAAAAPATQEPAATPAPATGRLADLTQALEEATTAFETAAEGFNAKDQAAALREINRLNREIAEAAGNAQRDEAAAVTQQAAEQAAFMEQWQAAETRVHGMFAHAGAADSNSALHQRAAEIQASYRDSQDPAMQAIYHSPNSVLLYFTQAASDLFIAPNAAPASSASPSPTKSTPPPVSRQVPVGAALLATSTGGNPAAFQGKHAYQPQSLHELEQIVERMAA